MSVIVVDNRVIILVRKIAQVQVLTAYVLSK